MPSTTRSRAVTRPTSRRLPFALMALCAAALHLLLWQGVEAFSGPAPAARQAPLQVRTLEAQAPLEAVEVAEAPKPPPPARPAPAPRRAAATPTPVTAEAPVVVNTDLVLVATALPAQAAAPSAPNSHPSQNDVPVYRTQMPPAITLNYDMSYGRWSGTGEMQWRPTASGYELRLEGRVAGLKLLSWASQGAIDKAGIAPVRFTDQRARKSAVAANFQREAGKITFSGNPAEYPLLQGSQDRLSWMLQLAAIAQADAKRLAAGQKIALYVVGAKGDADLWTFRVEGREDITAGDTPMPAVKLLREPRKPHDTRVEVWLAPGLHHLPVQARLTSEGSTMELRMLSSHPAS